MQPSHRYWRADMKVQEKELKIIVLKMSTTSKQTIFMVQDCYMRQKMEIIT